MQTKHLILQQIQYLRQCFETSAEKNTAYASAKNAYETKDSLAGDDINSNTPILDQKGAPLKLSNDISRKAYKKSKTITELKAMDIAKEEKDTALKRVEVEISVLSALKSIAKDEEIDDEILAKYDLLGDEAGI